MKINITKLKGFNMQVNTDSGHTIHLDAAAQIGGLNKGARPMEIMLSALGSCCSIDVISILKKSAAQISSFNLAVTGHRVDSQPRVFDKIELYFEISLVNSSENKVKRAIELSINKYCSVIKMLKEEVKISYQLKLKFDDWV